MTFSFINRAAPDIKRKLQRLECLGEKNIRELFAVTENMYYERESTNEKEMKKESHKNQHLAGILLAATTELRKQLRCLAAGEEDGTLRGNKGPI